MELGFCFDEEYEWKRPDAGIINQDTNNESMQAYMLYAKSLHECVHWIYTVRRLSSINNQFEKVFEF